MTGEQFLALSNSALKVVKWEKLFKIGIILDANNTVVDET